MGRDENTDPSARKPVGRYPFWAWLVAVIGSLALLLALFLTVFQLVVFDRAFAASEMARYEVAQKTGVSEEEIVELFNGMLDYIDDTRSDMNQEIVRYGRTEMAYSQRELLHMVDVKGLFQLAFCVRNIAAGVLVICLLILLLTRSRGGKRVFPVFYRGHLAGSGLFLAGIGFLGIEVANNFDQAFITFHELFFTNDLWQLDYATDMLMNIVPEAYSEDVITRTIIVFASLFLVLLALAILGTVLTKRRRQKA